MHVLTVAAEAPGIAGLLIDDSVRDIAALTSPRFTAFPRSTIEASAPAVSQPISFPDRCQPMR